MNRRRLLASMSVVLGGLAGCTGANEEVPLTAPDAPDGVETRDPGVVSGDDPARVVSIDDYTAVSDDEGLLAVTVAVSNTGSEQVVRYVRVTVTVDGQDRVFGRFVRLAAGETTTITVGTDVDYGGWEGVVPSVLRRTPATPFPLAPTGEETPAAATDTVSADADTASDRASRDTATRSDG